MTMILLIFAFIFVLGPIAQAYAKRLSQPLPPGVAPPELARLREEVDRLNAEVSRLSDEQSFMVRLLSDGERRQLERGNRSPDPAVAPPEPPRS